MKSKHLLVSIVLLAFHVQANEIIATHRCIIEHACPDEFCPHTQLGETDDLNDLYNQGCRNWVDEIDDGTLYLTYVPRETPTCRVSRLYPETQACDD